MKRRILSLLIAMTGLSYSYAQPCIDTVENLLTLLDKSNANGPDCLFSVKFCLRKTTADADHIEYAVYSTGGTINKTVDVSGIPVGSVICEIFTFIANCNSSATFVAVGEEPNNSTCGFVTSLIILPIRLLSFSGEVQKTGTIDLNWITASESNSSHFILQQSRDGRTYLDVAKIKAAGESNSLKSYSYQIKPITASASSLTSYFRLKMVDKDENFNYSQIISLGRANAHKFEMYPNPSSYLLTITKDDLQKEDLKMMNLQGQEISLIWLNANTLDIHDVYPGVYFVKYQNEMIRFVKE